MYGRETPDGWLRDALWLAVDTVVRREANATNAAADVSVRVEPR